MSTEDSAADWDRRVDALTAKLPDKARAALGWLREPSRWWVRIPTGVLFILGGIFSILPILGLWMLPVGLALLSQDLPWMKGGLEWCARRIEALVERVKAARRGDGR